MNEITTVSLVVLAACSVGGCDDTAQGIVEDAEDTQQQVQQQAAQAQAEMEQAMLKFRRESKVVLAEMDKKLERLGRVIGETTDQVETEAGKKLKELRQQKEKLRTQITQLKAESANEWKQSKERLDKAMAHLGKSIDLALDKAGDKAEEALD